MSGPFLHPDFFGGEFVQEVPLVDVADWVRELVDEVVPGLLSVGAELQHPDGRMVVIVAGSRWEVGGVSNWWLWHEVLPDGTFGDVEGGYGW
jgi:hypothetical protein